MAQPDYKFKPYKPTKLKMKQPGETDEVDKTLKSLEKQRANLEKRLLAEGIDPETLGGEVDNRNIIEKALNLNPDQGLLMDFFEIIDRPVQAVKSALVAGKKGDTFLQGFAQGLSGESEISGSEFLKELTGMQPTEGVGKFVTDVAADIVFDPLTYLPAGILAKGISKLNKLGGRPATELGVEIAQKLSKQVDDVVALVKAGDADTLKKVFTQAEVDKMLAVKVKSTAKGGAAEILAKEQITNILKNNGLDEISKKFQVVNTGTIRKGGEEGLRNAKDLAVIFEYEPGKFVQTSTIEVKDLISSTGKRQGAFGLSTAISMDDITKGANTQLKQEFLEKTKNVKLTYKGQDYTVGDYIKKVVDTKTSGQKSVLSTKDDILKVSAKDRDTLEKAIKDVFVSDLNASGVDFITFRYGKNKAVTLSRANAAKYIGVKNASLGVKATGAFVGKKGLTLISDFLAKNPRFKNQIKKIRTAFENATSVKKAANIAADVNVNGLVTANGNIVVSGIGDDVADALRNSSVFIEGGTTKINISDVQKLEDGSFVIKTSKSEAGKASRDLIAGIDLIDPETGKLLADDAIEALDESEAFGKTLFSGESVATTQELTLMGRARAGDFGQTVKTVANALKKFEIKFKLAFNLTAGFDDKTKALLRKAYGGDMFELERRSGILADIKQKLIDIDPDAGKLLGEIIEADAKIDASGKIVKLKRHMGTSDFFDYMNKGIVDGNGDKIIIPEFARRTDQTNFIKRLQKIYFDATGSTKKMFKITKRNGGTVLAFAGDASEMKDLIKFISNAPLTNRQVVDYLSFGQKSLSRKAKAFLRNNAEQIGKYKDLTDELLDDLINKAGFTNLPTGLQKQIGYMRHSMSKEAMEGLKKQMPGALSIYARPGKNTLGVRKFIGSAQEVNAALKEFYGVSDDFIDPNAFNAMEDLIKQTSRKLDQKQVLDIILSNKGVDGSELFKVVDNTQEAKSTMSNYDVMFKDFKEEFASLYNNLSDDSQKYFDEFLKKNGFGDGSAIQMNKSAFNVLKGVEKAYFDVPQLAKIYDKFLNTWKGLTLITPGFHMRNLFGNMFNSYAVGMDVIAQSKYLGKSMQELNQFQEIGKKLAQGLDITDADRALIDTVRGYFEQGVSQTHRGIRDLEGVMEASAKGAQKGGTLKNTYNSVVRLNFNFAEKMDDVQRYALYRWSLDKTGDSVKAANTVAEALFDYSHLTPFEKSYMKRLFPFYTFMKNNFVFQMKNIFKNPGQYAKLGRAYKYAIEDLSGYSVDDLPDYATENMWLPLPWTVDKNDKEAVAFLKATLPASDFTELVENPFKKGVTSITAPIKLLIEFGAGKDLFTGQSLEAFPGQKSAMEEGTGVLSGLRDKRGNLTISQSPLFIKIMNDLGLRAPINIASAGLDIVDTLAGYQGTPENIGDFLQRAGIAGVSEMDRLKLSKLYQDLEKLRELKKFYEQETGNQLPVLPRG